MYLRNESSGLVREIGDFIGHPDRIKGRTHDYVGPISEILDRAVRTDRGIEKIVVKSTPHRQLFENLNQAIEKVGSPKLEEKDRDGTSLLTFTMLQGCKIHVKHLADPVELRFVVLPVDPSVREAEQVNVSADIKVSNNMGSFIVPVLSMPNVYSLPRYTPSGDLNGQFVVCSVKEGKLDARGSVSPVTR
jgi:hypothetical protein